MFRLGLISRLRPRIHGLQVYEGYIMCDYLTEFYEEVVLTSREVELAASAISALKDADKRVRCVLTV